MLDDDIQYMGTRPAQRAVSDSPFSTRQAIYAIVLHIEKTFTDLPSELIFSRANTDVVHIGRLSSSESERWHGDAASALFKCAVVSRSHAKIVFSDSGHVAYLIDLKSHHGTHLRKPGETVSRMLTPETPTQLSEGDTITFGKSVGSNADIVRPIVVRIELRYRRVDSGLKPFTTPTNTVIRLDLTKGSPKSSSGRYGLYDSSSSSSDDSSSVMSDNDSDIEEIPASGANAVPLLPRSSHGTDKGSNLSRAFTAFKRLVSPVSSVSTVRWSERLRSRDLLQSEARDPMTFAHPYSLPPLDMSDECYLDSPIYSPYNLRSLSPMFNIPTIDDLEDSGVLPDILSSECSTSPVLHTAPYNLRLKNKVVSESGSDAISRSSSPMDLASSPAFSHCPSPFPEQANEPSIIGAYPKSRCSSPFESAKATPVEGANADDKAEVVAEGNVASAFEDSDSEEDAEADDAEAETDDDEDSEAENPEADAQLAGPRSSPKPSPVPQTSKAPASDHDKEDTTSVTSDQGVLASDVSRLRTGLTELQSEVEKLQIHRRKYKERFNTNVDKLSDKLSKMDKRIADVNAQYNVLCDQVADAMDVDIPDLQSQVEALQNQMDVLAPALDMTSEPPMHEREDVKTSIEALHDLVADMRTLREATQTEMAAALEAVRAARDAALLAIAAHTEGPQVKEKTPVLTSSKRKRYDEQDEEESGRDERQSEREHESEPKNDANDRPCRIVQDVGVGNDGTADVTMAEGIPAILPTTLVANHCGIDVPSAKRARRVAAVVVQTATAATVGAIATWSALAFS